MVAPVHHIHVTIMTMLHQKDRFGTKTAWLRAQVYNAGSVNMPTHNQQFCACCLMKAAVSETSALIVGFSLSHAKGSAGRAFTVILFVPL